MTKRSLVVSTAALAAVILVAVAALASADEPRVWTMRHSGDHHTDESAGWLGVSVTEAVDLDQGGARVRSVVSDSPAADAGLQRGDVIVAVDGGPVRGPASLTQRIRDLQSGDRVTLTVVRDGREETIDATLADIGTMADDPVRVQLENLHLRLEDLGERLEGLGNIQIEGLEGLEQLGHLSQLGHLEGLEALEGLDFDFDFDFDQLAEIGEQMGHLGRVFVERCDDGDCEGFTLHHGRPRLGVGLSDTTPELRRHLGGDDESGALVDRVIAGSPAEEAGLRVGDLIVAIDGEPVKNAWDIGRALQRRDGERLRVDVVRDGMPLSVDVTLVDREDDDRHRSRGPRA